MKKDEFEKLISFVKSSGKRLLQKEGEIKDVGIKKKYLTEEDLIIERGLKDLVMSFGGEHRFYSEEENDEFIYGDSVWIADPISGTKRFIEGTGNYAISLAHLRKGVTDFSLVYNPTQDSLYHADNSGAYLNRDSMLSVDRALKNRIMFTPSYAWKDIHLRDELRIALDRIYEVHPRRGAFAYNYCAVANGEFDGMVSLTKDSFPEFAGCYIANQSGCKATNINGEENISPSDRIFVCGIEGVYEDLFRITKSVVG